MSKNRMEDFRDGVLAIIITIMVLNFSVSEGIDFQSLWRISNLVKMTN